MVVSSRLQRRGKGMLAAFCLTLSCTAPEPGEQAPHLAEIAQGKVAVIDLTYPLNAANPYWPGGRYFPFQFQVLATLEKDGVYSGAFSTPEHLGTHLDAPNHFVSGQAAVDEIPLARLVAPLLVVDVRDQVARNPDYQLSLEDLRLFEGRQGPIPEGAVVAAHTGWGGFWNDYSRYKNADQEGRLHFPGFSPEAARFLVEERRVKGIGIDTLSVDYGLSSDFQVHHIVHGAGGYHLENLANLEQVPARGAWVWVAPVKIEGGSGGPARVWAVLKAPVNQD